MPITSCAPRFAERNARALTHAGIERPLSRKSSLDDTARRSTTPMPSTKAK